MLREKLVRRYREGGVDDVVGAVAQYVRWRSERPRLAALAKVHALAPWYRTFRVGGRRYRYAIYGYNATWRNERCVELPLALEVLRAWEGRRVLEVGNVLSHYTRVDHDVLDKYERAPGVINEDVLDFRPAAPYDLILSISTMEHIGWDEAALEPDKVLAAFGRLYDMVAPGGRLWVSIPRGYHRHLDLHVDEGRIPFTDTAFLRRVTPRHWKEVGHDDVHGIQFGVEYECAAAIMIGVWDKSPEAPPSPLGGQPQ